MVFSFSFSVFLGISKGFAQKNNLPEFPPKKRKNPSILDWSIPRFSRLFSSRGIPRPQIPRLSRGNPKYTYNLLLWTRGIL